MPLSNSTSPSLFGYLCAIDHSRSIGSARDTFAKLAHRPPDVELSTGTLTAQLNLSPLDKVGRDRAGAVTVVLHGEIYEDVADQAAYLAQCIADRGFNCVKELHGSFVLVVVDRLRDKLAVVTDRLNSRRMFASEIDGGVCISTHLSSQPCDSFDLDPTGIAWYLINRVVGNSRTLLSGVAVLTRASIHELSGSSLKPESYWHYDFSRTGSKANRRHLVGELQARLVEAVRRRLYDKPTAFLSLSAGYDATGLLGILACSLHTAGVECFSYDHGSIQSGSDADLARQMAAHAGYHFTTVDSFDGDFVDHIRSNAAGLAKSLSWYCAEEGAWVRLANRFAAEERPVVIVGDECLGWRRHGLIDARDVLASLQIYDSSVMNGLWPRLPADTRARFCTGFEQDFQQLQDTAVRQKSGDWHNAKDYLYLDQRLGNLILPWREAFVPEGVPVRSPLLDNDILDFVMTLPTGWRLNKRLYRATVTSMFPQLFSVPRSTTAGNYYLPLPREFAAHAYDVRRLVSSQSSRLDELIPPDVIDQLLSDIIDGRIATTKNSQLGGRGTGAVRRLAGRLVNRVFPARPVVPPVQPANLLLRLLVLRSALATNPTER